MKWAMGRVLGRAVDGVVLAVTTFTAIPMPARDVAIDRTSAARAMAWWPFVGAAIAGVAGIPLALTVLHGGVAAALLGSTLSIGLLAMLTRGLHLDGLADTVDALGSRRPPERALAIMREPDIGAFGVVALILVVLLQVASLTVVGEAGAGVGVGPPIGGLVLAAVTGRVAAGLAASPGVPSARREGFGALFAGTVGRPVRAVHLTTVATIVLSPLAFGADAAGTTIRFGVAAGVGLLVATCYRRTVVRRIGGVTGDVFGAVVEVGTCATLVVLAVATVAGRPG